MQVLRGRIEQVLGPMVDREVEGRSDVEEEGRPRLVAEVSEKVLTSHECVK